MNIKRMVQSGALESVEKLKGKVVDYNKIKAGAKNTKEPRDPLGDMNEVYHRLFKQGGAAKSTSKMRQKLGVTCDKYAMGGVGKIRHNEATEHGAPKSTKRK